MKKIVLLSLLGFGVRLGLLVHGATNALVLTPELVNQFAAEMRTNHPALAAAAARTNAAAAGVTAVRTWEDPMVKFGGMAADEMMRAEEGDIAFLRRTSLDEPPQILNILKGEMSLVRPRPVTQEEIEKYYKDSAELCYSVLPGITGLWQVSGRSNTSFGYRISLDSWSVRNWNLWLDIVILLKTVHVVYRREGAV